MRLSLAVAFCALATPLIAADNGDTATLNRIIDEGLSRSEIAVTAEYLADRIGGRITNSPQMREAEKWTQEQYRKWGLKNVHAEGFDFGRGWWVERIEARMVKPRIVAMRAIPVAWTPGTEGTLSAQIFVAPMKRERDFEKWKGQLRGKIVLVSKPDEGSEPDKAPFRRYSDEDLQKLDKYPQPHHSEAALKKALEESAFEEKRDAFLAAEGALALVRQSYRDGSLVSGEGYQYAVGHSPKLPGVELAAEDYRRLARLARVGDAPTIEINSVVHYEDSDHNAYNIFAEIPGRDAKSGYVMAGAHLDSWAAADGAADNGAGSVAVMEAARILSKLGVKPKRTIRFALWAGEEQGLLGSMAYVERYLATRPAVSDPELAKLNPYDTWNTRWPITPKPSGEQLAAYFNIDNGSGKVRGLYTEGNVAAVPIFREWLAPFASMGAATVVSQHTTGTDHVFMQHVGIPGFQFIQDELDYGTRVHHSNVDTYDHLKIADLKQAAVIMASMLWNAAERDQPLPRMPALTKPADTDPFSYDDKVEDDEEEED